MTENNNSNAIVVDKLTKAYGSKTVVNDVSFTVKEGETFGILGPNGAGKTTTLEMLESLRTIDRGSVRICGIDVASEPEKVRRVIGIQTQSTTFHDKVTLREHIQLFASIFNKKVNPTEALRSVQLEAAASSFYEQLSGGQKQRFSIAIALVHNPKVLFLDEPTASIDPQARRSLWELLLGLKEKGITIVITSHYMDEVERLCDRLAIMDTGKIIALDTPAALIDSYKKKTGEAKANLEDVFIDLTGNRLRD